MPDIGLLELVIIGLGLLLIVGPERMPEFFGQAARALSQLRRWVNSMKQQIRQEAEVLKDPVLQAKEVVRGEIDKAVDDVASDVDKELSELREGGRVEPVKPLSDVYKSMDHDDASKGFMQGHRAASKSSDDEDAPVQAKAQGDEHTQPAEKDKL